MLEDVLNYGLEKVGYTALREGQRKVVEAYLAGKDVFFCSPTGSGKSLCFEVAPYVFDGMDVGVQAAQQQSNSSSVCLIVAPLVSLMKDQVSSLVKRGISAAIIGPDNTADELKDIKNGRYNLLFGSPEALINTHRTVFRELKNVLKAVFVDESHCIAKWGKEQANAAAFRNDYGRLGELRSLLKKDTPFICLTATATINMREVILSDLCMKNCVVIQSDPNRPNTRYAVQEMDVENLHNSFQWLIESLERDKQNAPKVIVFCRRKQHMRELYELFISCLGDNAYHRPTGTEVKDDRSRLFAMYHKRTHKLVKETIEREFCKSDGTVRVLFCSIAFGMGVNVKNVYLGLHLGPSSDLDDYLQETGRIGRDSSETSHAVLLKFKGCTRSKNITKDMRNYVKNNTFCRREIILHHFKSLPPKERLLHSCCNICANKCRCLCACDNQENCTCKVLCEKEEHISVMEKHFSSSASHVQKKKLNYVSPETASMIRQQLFDYRSELAQEAKDKLVTGIDIATGYNIQLIDAVIANLAYIQDREYLQSNFAFYSYDHVAKTWEILENYLPLCSQEISADVSSDNESSYSSDDSEDNELSGTDSSESEFHGIVFSDDESTSEKEFDSS